MALRQVVELAENDLGGCKLASATIGGHGGVYGALKFESGIHRVQRVPVTESGERHPQGMAWLRASVDAPVRCSATPLYRCPRLQAAACTPAPPRWRCCRRQMRWMWRFGTRT